MAYTNSGSHNYTEIHDINDTHRVVTSGMDFNCESGIYGVANLSEVRPYFNQVWQTYLLTTISSVDDNKISYRGTQLSGGIIEGESQTINYNIMGGSSVSYCIGNHIFQNTDTNYTISVNGIATFPVFRQGDEESINNYIATGDDSGALNYDLLHGTKCNFFVTNNGDRISLKIRPQDNDKVILLDSTNLIFHSDIPLTSDKQKTISSYEYNTTWDSVTSGMSIVTAQGLINTLELTLEGYYKNELVCTLKAKMKKGVVAGIGNPSCTPIIAIDNDYKLYCSTDNMFDDISTPSDDVSDATDNNNDGSSFGGFTSLTSTYKVSKQALNDLGRFIWQDDAFKNIKLLNNSPLENIISIIYMPIDINNGTSNRLSLGNITTNISGLLLNQNMVKINIASFTMPLFNNGFLAYEPYTSISMYLPFVGMIDLQPKDVCGYTITIDYAFDVVFGSFAVFVYTSKGGGKTLIYTSQGDCSVNIPLSSSNHSNMQASLLQAGVGLVSDVATKNAIGVVNDISNIATIQNHTSTFGSPSSMVGALSPNYCYYIARTPIINLPENFAHTKGFICMETYKLSDLKGFTKLSIDLDLSGFNATDKEKSELINILTTGFYL